MSSVYSNFFWWGGTELNRHRNIRLIYSQLSSPLAQPPHKFGGSSFCYAGSPSDIWGLRESWTRTFSRTMSGDQPSLIV